MRKPCRCVVFVELRSLTVDELLAESSSDDEHVANEAGKRSKAIASVQLPIAQAKDGKGQEAALNTGPACF